MSTQTDRIQLISDVATDWCDADHPPRASAVEDTLEAPNRWTEQALTHLLNRWMQRLTTDRLRNWVGDEAPSDVITVGVLHADAGPLAGFRDALAVFSLGHRYVGRLSEGSPAILPSFAEEVEKRGGDLRYEFASRETVYEDAQALLAQPTDAPESVHETCESYRIPGSHRQVRPPTYSIGVVDGNESEDECGRLAEDMLLLEGEGEHSLSILWAPRDHSPDTYLEAMAHFRGIFPSHPDTPGALQMQQAFLEARDEPHAYADGLEFLVSRGEPQPQRAGHIRWTEYEELSEMVNWVSEYHEDIYAIIARRGLHDQLPEMHPNIRTPGGVHLPPLDDKEGRALIAFLREMGG